MTTEITFERAALYEEVWKTPLTRLGEKYGLSDNGLRKICRALHIPLPPFGHWARVEAGHAVEKTTLPPTLERTTFVSRPSGQDTTFHLPEDDVWLAERTAFEALAENRIVVQSKPNRWHAAVARFVTICGKRSRKLKRRTVTQSGRRAGRYGTSQISRARTGVRFCTP